MEMKKRGMLLTEETLKIVVAVIGLALLIYFLIGLYYSATGEKKQREATEAVEKISEIIGNLENSGQSYYQLQPQRWVLFSFTEDKKPNSCSEQKCMCICAKVFPDIFDRQIKKCDKNGACLVVSNLKYFEEIKIELYKEGLTNIDIKEINKQIEIRRIE